VSKNGNAFIGRGVSTDIIEASVRAYLNAINKALSELGEEIIERIEQ
jgi:2-isopropylmalate synthase